ncbi:MAG TPA: hypothetical protein VGV59_06755 [Pyrinomonadaceae bacterium]|nr:hypothetical protein [Pyrinomonadaceae bacterium]
MRRKSPLLLSILFLCAVYALVVRAQTGQTVVLYAPRDKATGKFNYRRASFSFELGLRGDAGEVAATNWDVGYGLLSIGGEDYFKVQTSEAHRSVIRDLGKFEWGDSFEIPALEPLPEVAKGERRKVVIDSSGGKLKAWEQTTRIFAKIIVGHIYLVRVKDEDSDFYVLFRVEALSQGESCTISWRHIPPPQS